MNDGREGLPFFFVFCSFRESSGRALRSAQVVCVRGVRFPRNSEMLAEWARGNVEP